ncbi:MAG: 4-hydroxybenzoate polyprenyltransferase [Candidatus Asgardarchaeum californiense]|nr:MAG: 4-hydroxybenzoate polyprenyltransferase [Candidatus Asgardarchaeum californiense]
MSERSFKQLIKGYIALIRPFTLLAPIIVSLCIMFASFVYSEHIGSTSDVFLSIMIPASFSLAILNGASNALNQVTDLKTDKISKADRPIPRGDVSIKGALIVSGFLYALAISLSLLVNTMFLVFVLSIAFFTVTYSLPPRFKDKLFLNQIWVGVPRGLLGILASWSVFGNAFESLPLSVGLIAMFFLIGGSITKDIIDDEADKKTGTHTLINTYGAKKASFMVFPFMFFPFAFIPILIDAGLLDSSLGLLTFLAIPSFLICYLMCMNDKKSKRLENTKSWALMYVTYFFLAIGFSVLTIVSSTFA